MKKLIILLTALLAPLIAVPSFAAQIRVFVAEISVPGIQNGNEMKATLQSLLASRLSGDKVVVVGSAAEADAVVSGTYASFGKVFSIDTIAKTPAGKTVIRAFVQGETQDELIPAVGKLAEKLSAELIKMVSSGKPATLAQLPSQAIQSSIIAVPPDVITNETQIKPAPVGDFIKPRAQEPRASSGWQSNRLIGAANLMAIGKTLSDGSREIFLAGDRRIAHYRQGSDSTNRVLDFSSCKSLWINNLRMEAGGIEFRFPRFCKLLNDNDLAHKHW